MRVQMQRKYHRKPKHDYTDADRLFAEANKKKHSRWSLCKYLSKQTGIAWQSLYARYFSNQWKHRGISEQCTVAIKYPKPINYLLHLNKIKERITARTGITDFHSAEGQAELARYQKRNDYIGRDYDCYSVGYADR